MQIAYKLDPITNEKIRKSAKISAGAFLAAFTTVFSTEVLDWIKMDDPINWRMCFAAGLGAVFAFFIASFQQWTKGQPE